MAITAADLQIKLSVDGAPQAKRELTAMGDAVDEAGSKSKRFGGALLGFGGAVTGLFTYGAREAISFGEQMANVNSIAQVTTAELAVMSDQVLELATNTGQSATVLAAGLYDISSSGFAGAEAMSVLEVSASAANAGLTSTDVAARAITASLNAYGMEASEAGHVSDVLFQTVNEGVITFEQLANNLGNTLPLANALGVSIEELGAGYARMTLSGVQASQAETQIAALMRSAINPTEDLTSAVVDYGYANVEALIAAEGMTGYLNVLNIASGGSKEALFDLLGTTEAVNAALILGGENTDEYTASVERMKASSEGLGATQTALAKQMESTQFSLRLLKTNIQAAAIAIGVQLEPGIKAVAKAMTAGLKVFLAFSKPVQKIIGIFTALAGALALVAGGVILFGSQIAAAGGLFLSLLGPIGLVIGAVAGLYYAWKSDLFGIQDVTRDAMGAVMDFLEPVGDFLSDLTDAWNDLGGATEIGGGDFASHLTGMADRLGVTSSELSFMERAMTALDVATGGMVSRLQEMSAIDIAVSIGSWLFDTAVDAASALGDWVLQQLGELVYNIPGIVVNIAEWIKGTWDDLWTTVKGWIMGGGESGSQGSYDAMVQEVTLSGVLVNIGQWIKGSIPDLWGAIKGYAFGYGADSGMTGDGTGGARPAQSITIAEVAVNIGSWVKGTVSDLWPYVEKWAMAAIDGATSAAGTLWSVVVNVGSWARGIVSDIWPFISMWAQEAWGAVQSTAETIWGVLVNVGSWANGEVIAPISSAINSAVDSSFADYVAAGEVPSVGPVDIKIESYEVDGNTPALVTAAENAAAADAAAQESAGYKYGFLSVRNFLDGVGKGFGWLTSGSGGGDGTGGGGGFGSLWSSIDTVFTAISDGFRGSVDGAISALESDNPFSDMMNRILALPGLALSGMGEGAGNMFGADAPIWAPFKDIEIPDITFDMPDITWPEAPAIGEIPFVTDLTEALDGISTMFDELSWSFDIKLPTISWPGLEDITATIPGWLKDFATMSPIDWVKKYVGGTEPLTGEDLGGGSGGGGKAYELPFASGSWTAALDQIQSVRVEMEGVKAAARDTGAALDESFGAGFDTSGITGAVSIAKTEMQSLATSAQLMTLSMAMAGRNLGQAFGTGVSAGITSAAGAVSSAVSGLITTAGGYRATALITGTGTGASFGSGMAAGIRSQSGNVSSAAAGLVAAAGGFRGTALIAGAGIGSALGQGIAAGIRSQLGNVIAAAVGIVNAAIGAAKLAGAISSPSRVMREDVGQMLGLGAVLGVQDMYGAMSGAMAGLISTPTVPYMAGGGLNQGGAPYVAPGGSGSGQVVHQDVRIGSINVPTTINIPDHVSDEEVIRIIRINAEAQKQAVRQALMAQGMQ